jgi:hypothetical protein
MTIQSRSTGAGSGRRAAAMSSLLALAACGGGDAGVPPSATPAPQASTLNTPIATDRQAKLVAARGADALFAYDNMNSDTMTAALLALPPAAAFRKTPQIAGTDGDGDGTQPGDDGDVADVAYPVDCSTGSATTTFSDADGDLAVSAGDVAVFAASACQPPGVPWVFGGSVEVAITGGNNVQQHLYNLLTGSAQLQVTHTGTAIGGGRTANGVYRISVSNKVDGTFTDQEIVIPDLTIAHPDVTVRMVDVRYTVPGSVRMTSLSGRIESTVEGIGSVRMALSLKSVPTIDANTTRFKPSGGTLRLDGADFRVDVEYGSAGAVTLRVDNGKDGQVDRVVTTTVAELDTLLTAK